MRSSAVLLAGLALAACSPATPPSPAMAAAPTTTAPSGSDAGATPASSVALSSPVAASASPLAIADAKSCPVTKPVNAPASIGDQMFGSTAAFGNGELWVGGLGPDGVIRVDPRAVESDGWLGWKFGWWRIAPGALQITGRRLDAAAPPLRASVPGGYGSSGFQATGVSFPSEGCWEVTGTVGSSALSFVTFVLRA